MRRALAASFLFAHAGLAGPAGAAPVSVTATLTIETPTHSLFPPYKFVVTGTGVVTVSGSTVIVPAGLVAMAGHVVIPVSGGTSLHSFGIRDLSNLAATFRVGGVSSQAPGEVCPGSGNHPFVFACNAGGGIGGTMGIAGTLTAVVIPMAVSIPIDLGAARFGKGGSTNVPFSLDAGAWSTGSAQAGSANTLLSFAPGTAAPLTLVLPTFFQPLGIPIPVLTTLTLSGLNVPEPASLLLIATGLAGLVSLRRR